MAERKRISLNRHASIHQWIRSKYGRASTCTSESCEGKSTKFQWALIAGKRHAKDISRYMQLCQTCHVKYDIKNDNRGHIEKSYSFVPVKSTTHALFKTLCAKNKKTFDQQLIELMKIKKIHDNATK